MSKHPPTFIAIDRDEAFAKYVGRTPERKQFFLTKPFVPAGPGEAEHDYLALYLFDEDGVLLEAQIEDLGPRDKVNVEQARTIRAMMLESLGKYKPGRILIVPFKVERFGAEFGLIAHAPKTPLSDWSVTAEPGRYMTFSPPWDNGGYEP
jgi:hypothetical protein